MSQEYYITRGRQDPPMAVTLSNARMPALIVPAKQDYRATREVGGLIVHRECSHSKGSARFTRSSSHRIARIETISRVIQYSRDMRACVN